MHSFQEYLESWLKGSLLFGAKAIDEGVQPSAPGLAGLRRLFFPLGGEGKALCAPVIGINLPVYQPAFHQPVYGLRSRGFGKPEMTGNVIDGGLRRILKEKESF